MLIRALTTGGAERQAVLLAQGLKARGHRVAVMVFYGGGALETDLTESGVRLIQLDKRGRWDTVAFLWRLVRAIRREQPAVIYSFLTVANLLTGLLGSWLPGAKRVWGLRASNMDPSRYDWLIRFTMWLEARLARRADLVIANSQAGYDCALPAGFPAGRLTVIRNGIDTAQFKPDREAGAALRTVWGVGAGQPLIGLAGRLDPMKGHPDFLQAAAQVRSVRPEIRFICIGEGPEDYRQTLTTLAGALGLADALLWAGNRCDMPAVYNALDIAVSASVFGEGVSNALGEAMASGVPCVTTDVGDSAWVVGDTGIVTPPGQPDALAAGLLTLLERLASEGDQLRQRVRARIEDQLSVAELVSRTLSVIEEIR